jgi:hypothetical protein
LTPGAIPARPWTAHRDPGGNPRGAGFRRRPAPLLVAAGFLAYLQLAQGNPWGLPVDNEANQSGGARDQRPPGPDWIQGTNTPTGAASGAGPGESAPARFGQSPDTNRAADQPPAWNGGWSGAGGPPQGAGAPPQGAGAAADRFRSDAGATDAPADTRAWPPGSVPAAAGYRYRGDPPQPGGSAGGWADPGAYRFRPLTEREQARQGARGRPLDAGQGAPHPSGTLPAWPPGAAPDNEVGPWRSR